MIGFFDDAIIVHLDWKHRLRDLIKGDRDALDSDSVRNDRNCELGKWIYGEGAEFAGLFSYQDLVKIHAAFHHCAADVIQAVQEKNMEKAEELMNMDGPFSDASAETVGAIGRLRSEIEREGYLEQK